VRTGTSSSSDTLSSPRPISLSYHLLGRPLVLIIVSASALPGLARNDVVTHLYCILELALSILKEDIHIQDDTTPSLPSAPTTSFELDAIGRECAQRAFWYIRLMRLTTFTYFHIPVTTFSHGFEIAPPRGRGKASSLAGTMVNLVRFSVFVTVAINV